MRQLVHRSVLCSVLPLALVSACGASKDAADLPGLQLEDAGSAGFAFTTVGADYQSSSLWYNDFATGQLREELSGESGDPTVKWLGNNLAFFNRKAAGLNVRVYDPRREPASVATQVATPGAAAGDPHAVLQLGNGRLLMAQYTAGTLVVTDEAFNLVATVAAEFDADPLRPEDLLVREGPSGREIYVLHQGRDKDFVLNDSQQVFILRDAGAGTLVPVDLDPVKAKVQGITLKLSNPGGFLDRDAASVLLASECTEFDGPACKAGLERVDLAARTTTVGRTFDNKALLGNGGAIAGEPGSLYWLMARVGADGKPKDRLVMKVEVTSTSEPTVVHTFPAESAGCCALFHEEKANLLLIGDLGTDGKGFFTALRPGDEARRLDLPGRPYTGALVPK